VSAPAGTSCGSPAANQDANLGVVLTIWTVLASHARFPPVGEPDLVRRLELIAVETAARKHKARP
jgi:hypothetical protein